MRELQEKRLNERNDRHLNFIKEFQSFGERVFQQKRNLPVNYVKVLVPREKYGKELIISPVTPIGGIYFVPTQEIIDEMSSDDEYEIRQISVQQRQVVITKIDEPWNPPSHSKFVSEDLYDDRITFFNKNVFCENTESEFHYVKFHKQPTAELPNQNFPDLKYYVDPNYLNTCMKAYKTCLYNYKLKIIVKQIEGCLLQGRTYIPHYDQCKIRNYREIEISESTVKDILIAEGKKYLIESENPSLYSIRDLLVPRQQVLEKMRQKIEFEYQKEEQEMVENGFQKLAKQQFGSAVDYNQIGELTFKAD